MRPPAGVTNAIERRLMAAQGHGLRVRGRARSHRPTRSRGRPGSTRGTCSFNHGAGYAMRAGRTRSKSSCRRPFARVSRLWRTRKPRSPRIGATLIEIGSTPPVVSEENKVGAGMSNTMSPDRQPRAFGQDSPDVNSRVNYETAGQLRELMICKINLCKTTRPVRFSMHRKV
jgi:hypothetical protein